MPKVRARSGVPTGPKGVEAPIRPPPAKARVGQASRCHTCGLSPPLLLGVAKKALTFGGLDGLLESPEAELLPSQLALLVIRSCLSLIEHYISEGRGSLVTPRASSSVIEPESDNQSNVVSDDESAEDQDSDGTITEGILSSNAASSDDEPGSDDDSRSDDDQRGQRCR